MHCMSFGPGLCLCIFACLFGATWANGDFDLTLYLYCIQFSWIFKYMAGCYVDHNCAKFKRNPSIGIRAIFFPGHFTEPVYWVHAHWGWGSTSGSGRHLGFVTWLPAAILDLLSHVTSGRHLGFPVTWLPLPSLHVIQRPKIRCDPSHLLLRIGGGNFSNSEIYHHWIFYLPLPTKENIIPIYINMHLIIVSHMRVNKVGV